MRNLIAAFMSDNSINKFLSHLSNCVDIDNLIVKGHILTEHALNFYIEVNSVEKLDKNSRLTYATKLDMAQVLGLFKTNKELKKDLKLLNRLRNSIAHNLKYDEKIFNDLLLSTNKIKNASIQAIKNSTVVYIRDDGPRVFEKVNESFVQLTGATKITGGHLKFCTLISYTCGLIFSLAEAHSQQKNAGK